jgi:SnoaL-like domain
VSALAVVRAWVRAFQERDAESLLALTCTDLEYKRWSGVERGHGAVRDLLHRQTYGVAMHPQPLRCFCRDDTVVLEVRVVGRYVNTGEVAGVHGGAAVFAVRGGCVVRYSPLPDLATALQAGGLSERDEVPFA